MQSALFSYSSPLFHYACPLTFHPFTSNETSRQFALSLSLSFLSRICLLPSANESGQENTLTSVFKKIERKKRGGKEEGRFRVLYSCEDRGGRLMRGIKESRKMNVSHEHHFIGRFHSFIFHPFLALFLSRASVLRVSLRMEACFEPSRNSSRLRPGS